METRVGPALRRPQVVAGAELERYRLDPRQAVDEHRIVCLVCGAVFRHLTNTHIRRHGLTPLDYKRAHGYECRRPLMCRALLRAYADPLRRRTSAARPPLRRLVAPPTRLEDLLRDFQPRGRGRWSVRDRQGRFAQG
jgi:hypothetical protein